MVHSRDLTGDLDAYLIFLAVMTRSSQTGDGPCTSAMQSTNIQSLSDSTGIPRESVRRKVARLEELGLVIRSQGLISGTSLGFDSVDALIAEIEQACREAGRPASA